MAAPNLSEFQRKLGYFFKDLTLLKMALTHPSVAHEQGPGVNVPHNQRLEFLGDAVLQLALTREFSDLFAGLRVLPTIDNLKGVLQELLQELYNEAPSYQLVSTTGPDHDRIFECSVHHQGEELARGSGKNKKEAESAAAIVAL